MMFSIIQAKPQYLEEIYAIILELAKHEGIYDKIKLKESDLSNLLFCESPKHFVRIALIDSKPVGLIMFNHTFHNICVNVNPGIYIENLYVSPKFQNLGIGTSLLQSVAQFAKDSNASRMEWWVAKNNFLAQQFYKNKGAEVLNNWETYKGGKDCIEKLLRNIV